MAAHTRALVRLCAAGVLAYCSYAICRTPLLPLFARELGATPGMVGLVVGASTVTGIFVKLPAGAWSDVLGRRALLVTGALIFATLPYTYLLVMALPLLIVLRALHGSATAVFGPVASAALSDLAPPHRRATWLSTYAACQGVGQAAGPVLAGYLIATRGFDGAFLAAGLIALAVPSIVAGWPQTARPERWRSGDLMRGIREVVSHRLILLTSGAQAAQFMTHGALSAFLPLYGREALGFSVTQLGWLFGLQTVTTLLIRPLIGAAADRVPRRTLISCGLVTCGIAVAVIAGATTYAVVATGLSVYAVGAVVTHAASSAYITDLASGARYGAAHGTFGTIYDVGDASGPLVGGLLVSVWGYAVMFRAVGTVAVVAAVVFFLASRKITPRPTITADGS